MRRLLVITNGAALGAATSEMIYGNDHVALFFVMTASALGLLLHIWGRE